MPQGMLGQALNVVNGLGWIGMADELRVQVARMIGWLQRKTEVVHGEHVFEKLRFLKITNAARLPRGVELMRDGVGACIEVMIIPRLVDSHTPQDDRGMIPVASDHAAHVVDGNILPGLVSDVLPSWNFLEYEQTRLIASVEKVT